MGKEMRRKMKYMTSNRNKSVKIFGYSKLKSYFRFRRLLNFEIMDFFDFVFLWSFVLSLLVGPFVVGSRMPLMWVVYLGLCTLLTPASKISRNLPIFCSLSEKPFRFRCNSKR